VLSPGSIVITGLKKDRTRGNTFHNLPVKKTRLAKQWLDQLRRDESLGFPKELKPENVYLGNLSKRSKTQHDQMCKKSLNIAPPHGRK